MPHNRGKYDTVAVVSLYEIILKLFIILDSLIKGVKLKISERGRGQVSKATPVYIHIAYLLMGYWV